MQRRLRTFKTKAFWTRTTSSSDFPQKKFPLRHLARSAAAIECKSDPSSSTSGSFGLPYQILNFFFLFCLRVPQRETTTVTWLQLRVCRRTKRAPACVYSNYNPTSVDRQSCKYAQHVSQPRVFNPFIAMLAAAPRRHSKTITDSAKIIGNHHGFFPASYEHVKGIVRKRTVLKVNLLQDYQIHCLQACMCAVFSLNILQVGAVTELKYQIIICTCGSVNSGTAHTWKWKCRHHTPLALECRCLEISQVGITRAR